VKHTDDKTNTALHWAAKCGRPKDITALLKAPGIEINARTKAGVTPLIYAASEGWDDCVQLLLAAGADRAAKTDKGRTARDATTMKMAKADAETKPRLEKVLRLLDAPQTSAPPADLLSTAATDDAKAKAAADAKATEAAAKAKAAGQAQRRVWRGQGIPVRPVDPDCQCRGSQPFRGRRACPCCTLRHGGHAEGWRARRPCWAIRHGTHAESWCTRRPCWAIRHGTHAESWCTRRPCWALRRGGGHAESWCTRRPCWALRRGGGHAEGWRARPCWALRHSTHAEGRTRRPCCTLWHGSHAEGWRTGRRWALRHGTHAERRARCSCCAHWHGCHAKSSAAHFEAGGERRGPQARSRAGR
jgi:hypothetical protein